MSMAEFRGLRKHQNNPARIKTSKSVKSLQNALVEHYVTIRKKKKSCVDGQTWQRYVQMPLSRLTFNRACYIAWK